MIFSNEELKKLDKHFESNDTISTYEMAKLLGYSIEEINNLIESLVLENKDLRKTFIKANGKKAYRDILKKYKRS